MDQYTTLNNLKINQHKNNILDCEVFAGCNFSHTLNEAINTIKEYDDVDVINYSFNGIPLRVDSTSTFESVNKNYNDLIEKRHQEYINSAEYKKQQQQFEENNKINKQKTEEIAQKFDASLSSTSDLIKWIGEFANAYDIAPISCNKKEFAEKMKAHGYDRELLDKKELSKLDEKSQLELGILANTYQSFNQNQPVLPIAYDFSLKYAELEKKENVVGNISAIRDKKLPKNPNKKYDL